MAGQTTLCVPLEVRPEACSRLIQLIEALKRREDDPANTTDPNFARLLRHVPTLHFMSMSVFPSSDYDPIFILEANFDGRPGVFWAQLEALIGDDLRAMVRCCKQPRDSTGPLYAAVTDPNSRAPVASYLEARTQRPSVYHHGNRGLTRDRILAERSLFLDIQHELDDRPDSPYRGVAPAEAHRKLRNAMRDRYDWLGEKAPPRIGGAEKLADKLRFIGVILAILAALAIPGLLIGALAPGGWPAVLLAVGLAGLILFTAGRAAADRPVMLGALGAGAAALALGWVALDRFAGGWRVAGIGVASIVYLAALLVVWIRSLELRDSPHDRPQPNERILREMIRREDWVTQNHMGSIVLVKPGVLRTIILRVGHFVLHLLLRQDKEAQQGYLGSMRTVHFAHWAFLNNHSRLLFLSNFDHSWDSYLDDFIEKAHAGLTLAWGCGVGFPITRLLIGDGASRGRQFKAWALASRSVTRFWFSAYPDLTVDQIERNNRIANGLREASLSDKDAEQWMRDL